MLGNGVCYNFEEYDLLKDIQKEKMWPQSQELFRDSTLIQVIFKNSQ